MPCYYPLNGWRARKPSKNGKFGIVFNMKDGHPDLPMTVPCGQCIGCRLEHSRQWAIRCVHEASLHSDNCFLTLTYNNKHLPEGASLEKTHLVNFMKYLRRDNGPGIRFFACGEYGYQYDEKDQIIKDSLGRPIVGRPHYHVLLFGFDFKDKYYWKDSYSGNALYRSEVLEALWPKGYSYIGTVTFESAAYVARYCTKKLNGEKEEDLCQLGLRHYERLTENGEIISIEKEYTNMSRRPGIGNGWFGLYSKEIEIHDSITLSGKEVKPPRYYTDLLGEEPLKDLKGKRQEAISRQKVKGEYSTDRLRDKEKVKKAQNNMLKRKL